MPSLLRNKLVPFKKCLTSILSKVKVVHVHMERKVSLKETVAVKTMVNPWLNG